MSVLEEYAMRHVPAYYPEMYLDGFTPDEIMYAVRKAMREQIALQQSAAAQVG